MRGNGAAPISGPGSVFDARIARALTAFGQDNLAGVRDEGVDRSVGVGAVAVGGREARGTQP